MNDNVIEAAAKAMLAADDAYDPDGSEPGLYTSMAIAGIKAADAARAEDVKAAVEELSQAGWKLGFARGIGSVDFSAEKARVKAAERSIFTLLNIED